MKRRTETGLFGGLITLIVVGSLVMLGVIGLLIYLMFRAADRGDTAHVIAYGVLLLLLARIEVSRSKS